MGKRNHGLGHESLPRPSLRLGNFGEFVKPSLLRVGGSDRTYQSHPLTLITFESLASSQTQVRVLRFRKLQSSYRNVVDRSALVP